MHTYLTLKTLGLLFGLKCNKSVSLWNASSVRNNLGSFNTSVSRKELSQLCLSSVGRYSTDKHSIGYQSPWKRKTEYIKLYPTAYHKNSTINCFVKVNNENKYLIAHTIFLWTQKQMTQKRRLSYSEGRRLQLIVTLHNLLKRNSKKNMFTKNTF